MGGRLVFDNPGLCNAAASFGQTENLSCNVVKSEDFFLFHIFAVVNPEISHIEQEHVGL